MKPFDETRVVLHVGAHKTGTSLVQKFLRDTPRFRERHHLTYVSRADCNDLIGWGKVPLHRPELLRGRLESEAERNPGHTIMISHENSLGRAFVPGEPGLYPHARRCAKGLRAVTEGFDVRVVVYVRPVADFVESYYLQTVHEGGWRRFDEWVAELDPPSWRWEPVVDALDGAFGAGRVLVGDFCEIENGQVVYLDAFMKRAGLTDVSRSELSYRPVRNASISARGLAMALDVNPLLHKEREEPHQARKFLQKHWSNLRFERARPMPDSLRSVVGSGDHPRLAERARREPAGSAGGTHG